MEQILRWLAGLGDEPLPAGETLRFEFLSVPKGGLGFALLVGFLAVSAGIYLIYRRDAEKLSFGKRSVLALLRFLALLSVVVVLLEPSLVKVRKIVRPGEVLLLADSSQSMTHKDSYARSPTWGGGWQEIGVPDPSAVERIDLERALLGHNDLVAALARKNRVRPYLFGGSVRPAPEVAAPAAGAAGRPREAVELPPPPVLDLAKIDATEGSTNLTASLRQALEASRDTRIAAVVVVTDGRRNAGGSPEEAGAYLKRRKVGKLLVVAVGDPAETWSVGLRDLQAPERVFKKDPIRVSAIVVSQGYGEQSLNLRLTEVTADGKKVRDLHRVSVDAGGDRSSAEARFPPITLQKEGEHYLRVEVDPPLGEPVADRHSLTQRVEVLSEKLRVLMIAGSPTHEYRILRNFLIRDNTVDVSCWLQSADSDFPQDGNTKIKELPRSAKELAAYDVVVMVDPDPVLLDPGFVQMVGDAIQDLGTGMWWVAGEKFSLASVRPGSRVKPLVDLLPVEPDVATAEHRLSLGLYWKVERRWKLTQAGRDHRVTSFETDPVVNALLWSKLPGYYWSFPVLRPKPAARVLVKPERRSAAADESWPLLVLQFVGAGRVLYSGTDETYRWRSVAQLAYQRLWVKGLRWLYEGKLAGGSTRYRLGVSAATLTLGQEVEIYLRALDENLQPATAETAKVRVTDPAGVTRDIDLPHAAVGEGRYRTDFRPSSIGTWTVQALGEDGSGGETAGRPVTFDVIRSELESKGPMGLAELTRFVEPMGPRGEIVAPKDLVARALEIPSATTEETFTLPFPLWDTWITLVLVLGFLTAEWILRKRFDLL